MGRTKGVSLKKSPTTCPGRRERKSTRMLEAVKLKRRVNGKRHREIGKMYVKFRTNYDKTIKNSLDSRVVPWLGTLLDLLNSEDVGTSQQKECIPSNFCAFSTWAREKHCVEAKLYELKAKLKTVVTGLREVISRLHEDFDTKCLSSVQTGKQFFPSPNNGLPIESIESIE